LAEWGRAERAGRPVKNELAQFLLQFTDLGGQGRLGDETSFGCPAEMAVIVERKEVAELLEGQSKRVFSGLRLVSV